MLVKISLTVNGVNYTHEVEPRMMLVQFLRDVLRLTGTHVGCDTSSCGACNILINGTAAKSCTLLAVQANQCSITTIEGIANEESLHPVQEGFRECHGLQCGFCTPGMIVTAVDILKHNPDANEHEIREALEGNFCRCTGYHNIVRAVQYAGEKMKAAKQAKKEAIA
jgi:aerobic carbon-monoxide dehydrogenase small subunit